MVIRFVTIIILIFSFAAARADTAVMVWVEFKDKESSPYSLSRPHEFLSERAIERRLKQNISLDFYDLPVSPGYIELLLSDTTLQLYYTSRWFNGVLLKTKSQSSVDLIEHHDFVFRTEIVKPLPADTITPIVPVQSMGCTQYPMKFMSQYTLDRAFGSFPFPISGSWADYPAYGEAENQTTMLRGDALHNKGYAGKDIVIALLDAGYRNTDSLEAFQWLREQNRLLGYYDFVQSKAKLYQGHAHGTYVLSVMAGHLPETFSGAAIEASYWLLRTEDAASEYRIEEYNWLAGAEFADSVGADIINSSLGYTVFDDSLQNYTYADMDGQTTVVARAANMASDRGMLVVSSGGNYGAQNWRYIGSPADAIGVLSVGGTDEQGSRVGFSSIGPSYDGRIKPEIMAQAQGVSVINYLGAVSYANGTSFSSPVVASLAACLWQMFPMATNDDIRQAVIQSSDRYLNPDSLYGFGIPDFAFAKNILNNQFDEKPFVKLASNPLVPQSAIRFYTDYEDVISIDMFNSNGQKIWSQGNISVIPGFNEIKPFYQVMDLSSGIYLLRINFSNRTEFIKAMKL